MQLEYELTANDQVRFMVCRNNSFGTVKRSIRNYQIFICGTLLLMSLSLCVLSYSAAIEFLVAAVVLWFIFPWWIRRKNARFFKAIVKEGGEVLIGERVTELHDDGIFIRSKYTESKFYYHVIDHIHTTEHFTYVIPRGGLTGILLPHLRLDAEQLKLFLTELQRRIEQAT